jgi:hypothetical protein
MFFRTSDVWCVVLCCGRISESELWNVSFISSSLFKFPSLKIVFVFVKVRGVEGEVRMNS